MNRRTLLASGATAAALGTAGCSALGGPVELGDPETGTRDDGRREFLTYRRDDRRILTLGFDQRNDIASLTDRFGFRISVPHSDDTTIESLRFDLRAPQFSVDPPAEIYLQAPTSPWPDFVYEGVEDLWTRIALPDVGELGQGTMVLDTIVNPVGEPATEVGIRAEIELSGDGIVGGGYRLDTATEFEPVVG